MRKAVRFAFVMSLPLAACAFCADDPLRPKPMIPGFIPMNSVEGQAQSDDMSAPVNKDEVVRDLMEQLQNKRAPLKTKEVIRLKKKKDDEVHDVANEKEQFTVNAQDAARKLASLGKRAVPELALLFKTNYDHPGKDAVAERAAQLAYYSAWALARIRNAEAARTLIPLMTNPAAPPDLRMIAVDAAGWEKSEEGIAVLEKAAKADPDLEIRKHALSQLSMIPEFWQRTEPIFVSMLSDPSDEIRVQAAKACHYSHMFLTANPKLIELLERDPSEMVRLYAVLTLSRLKVYKAQAAMIRVLQRPDVDEKLRKQVFTAITYISGIPFRSVENVVSWWEKTGRTEFENAARVEREAEERADDIKNHRPIKAAPKSATNQGEAPLSGAIIPAPVGPAAEIIPLDEPAPKESQAKETPVADVPDVPVKTISSTPLNTFNAPDENLNPNESSGSQRRRKLKNP